MSRWSNFKWNWQHVRAPLPVVAWRLLWIVPLMLARAIFVGLVGCAGGWSEAKRAWRDTA
jgi:hypothetical protein